MKIQLLASAISLSLLGCVATDDNQTAESVTETTASTSMATSPTPSSAVNNIPVKKVISPKKSSGELSLTMEQIMADPEWIGRSPESWYWGDDSQSIFYKQKRVGEPTRDLYKQRIGGESSVNKVSLQNMHIFADKYAKKNVAGTHEVYTFEGNVFLKTLKTNEVIQLTHTSARETQAMFLNDGNIAYRIGDKFFRHHLDSHQVVELANLKMTKNKEKTDSASTYLGKEQRKLIGYLALQAKNKAIKEQEKRKLRVENSSITQTNFYFGKDNKISHASLSPAGDKMIVSITSSKSSRKPSDIMPNYIADNGLIKAQNVRHRVADNREYKETIYLLDLELGTKEELAFDTLPGFDQDVLANVRAENYAREGKVYESKRTPRHIHVINSWFPISWSENGSQVGVMLEAWDNKDRWLTTVDFEKKSFVSQHRLHDDAWINWSFNEFGWVDDNQLYYLSEETGYSHLYVKPVDGKAKQLTSGKFEVSAPTLSNDKSTFYFSANKTHPGITEVYKVNATGGDITPITKLGGKNSYALSPDEKSLLIQHSEVTMPPELYVKTINSPQPATRVTYTVSDEFSQINWVAPTIVAIDSSHQNDPIYSRVYLPQGYEQQDEKLKAVMFTHGAGYLQNSHLGWSGYFREFMFHSLLVQKGYAVIDMDYRASAGYGRDWRTAIYRHMGKPEVEDMRDGVNWLVENANVDRQRIGTYGGSYGGFLTLMSMFTEPDLFQSGSALRLVSDWAYYNHGYTSNILNTPGDDAIAYERSSPIYFAEGLEKPLLINAPMVDDNVFFQDTVRLVQRLIELEKENFETAIYPVEPHGFVQPSSWLNEYRRILKLFESTL